MNAQMPVWELVVRLPSTQKEKRSKHKCESDRCYLVGVAAQSLEDACRAIIHDRMGDDCPVKSITKLEPYKLGWTNPEQF